MPLNVEVSFASVQRYILSTKCNTCHAGTESPKGVDLSSYEAIMGRNQVVPGNPEASPLYQSVTVNPILMPKGANPLPPEEISLLYQWILRGALKSGEVEPPPPPPEPTFAWISNYVFAKRCTTCHNGKHEKTKLDLQTYESVMGYEGMIFKAVEPGDPDFSLIYTAVNDKTMPPKDMAKLEAAEVAAVREWIINGAKETP